MRWRNLGSVQLWPVWTTSTLNIYADSWWKLPLLSATPAPRADWHEFVLGNSSDGANMDIRTLGVKATAGTLPEVAVSPGQRGAWRTRCNQAPKIWANARFPSTVLNKARVRLNLGMWNPGSLSHFFTCVYKPAAWLLMREWQQNCRTNSVAS
jgi:hypothetical protein